MSVVHMVAVELARSTRRNNTHVSTGACTAKNSSRGGLSHRLEYFSRTLLFFQRLENYKCIHIRFFPGGKLLLNKYSGTGGISTFFGGVNWYYSMQGTRIFSGVDFRAGLLSQCSVRVTYHAHPYYKYT